MRIKRQEKSAALEERSNARMKATNDPETENPGANDDGGGERRNRGEYGYDQSSEE